MKVFSRISYPIFPILLIILFAPLSLKAEGGIHPRGSGSSDAPATKPASAPEGMVLGTVEVNGEVIEGQAQVFLRGQKGNTKVLVIVPTEAFAAGKVLDRETLPYAVGKNLTLTLREFEADRSIQGANVGIAQGSNDRRTGSILDLPSRTASATLLMLPATGTQVSARVNYLFEEPIRHRYVDYAELNFLAYPEDLEAKWTGNVDGSGSLAQVEAEETVELAFAGEGLGRGKAYAKISPMAFAAGQSLDLSKIQSGSTQIACANNVIAKVTYGDKTIDRRGNFKVTLKKGTNAENSLEANLNYDFSSTYPAQDVRLDLKSQDLTPCYEIYQSGPMVVGMTIPAYEPAEPREPGEPVQPEDTSDGTPPDAGVDVPGPSDGSPAGTVGGNDFRPEHFVDDGSDNKITATGNAVTGGSKGIACAIHFGGGTATDLWMIMGVLGSLIPMLRRFRK